MAGVPGIVGAFLGCEEVERRGDQLADLLVGPRAGGAQERFQFGEREKAVLVRRISTRTIKKIVENRSRDSSVNLGAQTPTSLIEVRQIDRRNCRIERLVRAGRRPSVPVSDLRGHFFTAK
jgi:hypothetical protein